MEDKTIYYAKQLIVAREHDLKVERRIGSNWEIEYREERLRSAIEYYNKLIKEI